MLQYLRSLLFTIVMQLTAALWGGLLVFTFPLKPDRRYLFTVQWARFMVRWMRVAIGLRYRVHGSEHLPAGPAIILSKHQSAWETIVFQEIFPPQVWVLKRELLWLPFFGWGLAVNSPIAIDRSAGLKALDQVVRQGIDRLQRGRWVVVFPEGTRMPYGERGKYNPGGALLAARSGYPVVPVAHNAGRYWPRKGILKRPGTVEVHIGPVIDPAGKTAKQINALAEQWIEEKMKDL